MSIAEPSSVQKAFRRLRRHGLASPLHLFFLRLLNCIVPFRILRGVHVKHPDAAFLGCPPAYTAGFLAPGVLQGHAGDPATELSSTFVEDALRHGDECYAIRDGATLAAYGWYSTRPTPIGSPDLVLHFDEDYVYMYKGFTDHRYRGQRLHAIGMTRALQHYRERGYKGIVSYVESTNFDSLKSCFRMGYEVFGSIYLLRLFGRHFAFASPGCDEFDFRVEVSTPRPEQLSAIVPLPARAARRHTSRRG
jgi:hypothetical protein